MNELFAGGSCGKRSDDIGVGDLGQLVVLFGEAPDVVPEGLARFLLAAAEVPGVTRACVCAPKVSYEDFDQIAPVEDLPWGKVFQPSSCRVGEEQGEVADDDEVILRAAKLARKAVVR